MMPSEQTAVPIDTRQASQRIERLWTWNFFLLWQGQLVSALGDVVYGIALGFWVLAVTGSTALMGSLMAATSLPRIIISSFAGVFVDRGDRRKIMIAADVVRGVCIVLIGIAATTGVIRVWMVFAAGVILGICGAFFNPAAGSIIPDIVPKSQVVRASSVFEMIYTGTSIVGNTAGGFLYQLLGAPLLFLFNGISYLFSAFTEVFIQVPGIQRPSGERHFLTDMKEGIAFVWKFRGLRYLIVMAAFLNFFAGIGHVLILPLFQRVPDLGPVKYGIAMAVLSGGVFLGMLATSLVNVPPARRLSVFMACSIATSIAFALFPLMLIASFPVSLALLFVSGFANAVINVFFMAIVQMTVPQDKRGKVFGFTSTVLGGLSPISMAVGGVLAEFIDIRAIIFVCYVVVLAMFLPFGFVESFRRFINFDPERQTVEEVM